MARPKVAILSVDRIATAALDLVATTGDFTMPGLAQRLKVSPSSIYHHVKGREQIIELLREMAMSEVELPDPSGHWIDVVADIMRSYRSSFARYPRLIPLLTAYPVGNEQAVVMYNALAATLTEAGFTPADTLRTITLIDSFVLGSALDVTASESPWASGPAVGPELNAALSTGARAGRSEDAFEFGLAMLLHGLRAHGESAPKP